MEQRNKIIDYIKGFAIISVICAHCNAVLDTSNRFAVMSSLILQNIGTLGVICFFVISGMLFHYPEKPGKFFKKKVRDIIIPWMISANCVYFYVYLRKPPVTLAGWTNFVLGNGSYCYYLTVLMILYILFTLIPCMRKNVVLLVCEGITIVSVIWFYDICGVNPYLNILNWIGYFALGMMISKNHTIWNRLKKYIDSHFKLWTKISGGGYVVLLVYQLYHQKGGGYWKGINVIVCWVGAIMLAMLSVTLEKTKDGILKRIIYQVGIDSFAIYIWHMPIAGIIARIMCIEVLNGVVLIRPAIVLLIMLVVFNMVKKCIDKMKFSKYLGYLGLRI